jgi:hypothetical protein
LYSKLYLSKNPNFSVVSSRIEIILSASIRDKFKYPPSILMSSLLNSHQDKTQLRYREDQLWSETAQRIIIISNPETSLVNQGYCTYIVLYKYMRINRSIDITYIMYIVYTVCCYHIDNWWFAKPFVQGALEHLITRKYFSKGMFT